MLEAVRHSVLWLLLLSSINVAEASDHTLEASNSISESTTTGSPHISNPGFIKTTGQSVANATCISRTINYITNTLPQQCLRTDRVAATGGVGNNVSTPLQKFSSFSSGTTTSSSEFSTTIDPNASPSAHGSMPSSSNLQSIVASSSSDHVARLQSSVVSAEAFKVEVEGITVDADSPLDTAKFLSFEEWKIQNLAKAGQSPEHVGQGRQSAGRERRPINNALDGLGEENEIDLDFSGFGSALSTNPSDVRVKSTSSDPVSSHHVSSGSAALRSRDAGKTCKERTNYASFDCAATILKSNPECKSASAVLVENKDSYMLNPCSVMNKYFIVELCDDILIDTIVLANYEFFSSIFRHFRVSVSDRYPVKMDKWKDLGTFEAQNTRGVQAFLVQNPLIWARYLRVEFLSHYGNEYYCPLSLLRVHGTTMMEEFRHQEEPARDEFADDQSEFIAETPETPEMPLFEPGPLASAEKIEEVVSQDVLRLQPEYAEISSSLSLEAAPSSIAEHKVRTEENASPALFCGVNNPLPNDHMTTSSNLICSPSSKEDAAGPSTSVKDTLSLSLSNPSESNSPSAGSREPGNSYWEASATTTSNAKTMASSSSTVSPTAALLNSNPDISLSKSSNSIGDSSVADDSGKIGVEATTSTDRMLESAINGSNNTFNFTRPMSVTSTASHQPQPSTQESFFKSIHKRLQQLESNSTLSLQYIEEQSRILRDAFNKVEKRQISTTEKFLSHLNETVMGELRGFQQAYDQLWQSTIIELETQKEQYQHELLALGTRLSLVADELVWQKRMGIVQSTLLLLCLGLVLFARQGNGYLELPLAQQLMSKSQAAFRAGWESEPNSPSPISRSPVTLLRRGVWRSVSVPPSNASESQPHVGEGVDSIEVQLQPPTPSIDDEESLEEEDVFEELEEEKTCIQSGPAPPNGTGTGLKRPPDSLAVGKRFVLET
ncbi:hypothetical protein M433DRAFT_155597 [Acidomyces richmondensis BFW]|nr:MAG: hypothetical protein FE78DRAFT_92402 [Acidomyces sp. 'richmondensis']KYG44470.1 hypothetical protein M433DRAFT_155597 [Acidomyces richmondensis BFW]